MFSYIAIFFLFSSLVEAGSSTTSTVSPQPAYQPQVYPVSDTYGNLNPYEGYPYSSPNNNNNPAFVESKSSLTSSEQTPFQKAMVTLGRIGLYLAGITAVLFLGSLFTALICHFTQVCHFQLYRGFNNETVRALMSPEKISTAAAMVQDAIGKYQRLQRAVNGQ